MVIDFLEHVIILILTKLPFSLSTTPLLFHIRLKSTSSTNSSHHRLLLPRDCLRALRELVPWGRHSGQSVFECMPNVCVSYRITYLISPFVDHRHVDIVHENCHLLASRRSIRCTHPLVDVTFHRALSKEMNTVTSDCINVVKRF